MSDVGRSMQKDVYTCDSRREYDRTVKEQATFLRSLGMSVNSLAVPVSKDRLATSAGGKKDV
jgi:hypothetical protein